MRACRGGAFLIAHLFRYDMNDEVGKGERGHRLSRGGAYSSYDCVHSSINIIYSF